jgi:apolipoprotein N-acyltransferase
MNIKISSILNIGLLILAFVFAAMGFAQAGDSHIAPLVITTYMVVAAILFGVLAVRGVRQKVMWQRLLGVAAVVATLYMLVMAIGFYVYLSQVQMPTF